MENTQHITLANPGNENRDEMTPARQGRDCAACPTTVIDFKLITSTLLAAIVMLLLVVITPVWSQQADRDVVPGQQTLNKITGPRQLREIRGRVMDVHNKAMAGFAVYIKGSGISTVTDDAGAFTLMLPDTMHAASVVLEATMGGKTFAHATVDLNGSGHGEVLLYLDPSMKIINLSSGKSDLIRTIGGPQPTDIVAMSPGIYQPKRAAVPTRAEIKSTNDTSATIVEALPGIYKSKRKTSDTWTGGTGCVAGGNFYVIDGVHVCTDSAAEKANSSLWVRATVRYRGDTMTAWEKFRQQAAKPFRKKHKTHGKQ